MRYVHDFDNTNVLTSVLMIVIGLVLALWPGHVMTTTMTILGIALLVGGGISVFGWWKGKGRNSGPLRMAEGVAMAVGGLVVLIAPKLLISIIPIAIGLVVIFNGVVNLAQALDLRARGYSNWSFSLALAILTLVLGLLILFNPFSTMEMLVAAIGVVILYNGASNLWIESRYRKLF